MKTGNTGQPGVGRGRDLVASMEPGHEDREYPGLALRTRLRSLASMEPGHEDREYSHQAGKTALTQTPQWSPVMKTGNTWRKAINSMQEENKPQWSPVMKTGNTSESRSSPATPSSPQWSPVMKTGNTRVQPDDHEQLGFASMEPGHEDREYLEPEYVGHRVLGASMEPGHEDREYANPWPQPAQLAGPQWSPVMKTGNTGSTQFVRHSQAAPQWSPVMKTGNTGTSRAQATTRERRLNGARS